MDPAGRRIRSRALDANDVALEDHSWVYDGDLRVIAELAANGKLKARYLYATLGHSPDVAVTFHPDSGAVTGVYLLVHDQVGSVVRTLDVADGSAVESVEYDAWGVATVSPGGTSVHPFGFAGGLWDRRTGLVSFGAREDDAGLGRWLARDPIGFGGGWNQYGYVGNLPTELVDPTGLVYIGPKPDGLGESLPGARKKFLFFLWRFATTKWPQLRLAEMQGDSSPKRPSCPNGHTPDQEALVDLLQDAKNKERPKPISEDEADILMDWARKLFPKLKPPRKDGPHEPPIDFHHIHAGGVKHVPYTPK